MAFTGVAVIKQLADNLVRVTGLSLVAGASGTIGVFGGGGEVTLPRGAVWQSYAYNGVQVSPQQAVQIWCLPVTDVADFAIPIRIVKGGATDAAWLATLTNDAAATNSAELEIYCRFH